MAISLISESLALWAMARASVAGVWFSRECVTSPKKGPQRWPWAINSRGPGSPCYRAWWSRLPAL